MESRERRGHHGRASRNKSFERNQPFQDKASLIFSSATGIFKSMNPTRARFEYVTDQSRLSRARSYGGLDNNDGSSEPLAPSTNVQSEQNETQALLGPQSEGSVSFLWSSRDSRKGRHPVLLRSANEDQWSTAQHGVVLAILHNVEIVLTRFPYWDLAWLIAVTYTLGSVIWIFNGSLVVSSIVKPGGIPHLDTSTVAGWTAFLGGTLFFVASVMMMLEALGFSVTECFGWDVEQNFNSTARNSTVTRSAGCEQHHRNIEENTMDGGLPEEEESNVPGDQPRSQSSSITASKSNHSLVSWLPSWDELRHHYLHELGFVACSIQTMASTLFWVSKILAIPPVSQRVSNTAMVCGYYVPSVIGGAGFVIASILLILETQSRWYLPAIKTLGWHVCFWKLVGSVAFTISGAIGPFQYSYQGAFYQSSAASLLGSCAMLVGSLLQVLESLDKHPVITEDEDSRAEWQDRAARRLSDKH